MADPLTASQLVSALKNEGLRVVEYKSWRTNNRNHVGDWGPVNGVMIHHTVTSGTSSSVELCYSGHSNLPGPLCHGVIDKDGTVYLVGNGRANHAGLGDGDVLRAVIEERSLPPDNEADTDGNSHFYGFECVNLGDGRDPWTKEQVDAIVKASSAICRAHGWSERSVIGHLEWQPGKVDPRPSPDGEDVRMDSLRDRIKNQIEGDEDPMPERVALGIKSSFSLPPRDWTQVKFDRFVGERGWEDRNPQATILVGPAYYSLAAYLEVEGLQKGQEFQIRFVHNERQDGEWVRSSNRPISSPVHDELTGKFTHVWNGFIPGRDSSRVCLEVYHMSESPVEITEARIDGLYWRSN